MPHLSAWTKSLHQGSLLAHFKKFLLTASEKKKKVLLIIDEAQLLSQEMLEEIRLLSNIEKPDAKLINIFSSDKTSSMKS